MTRQRIHNRGQVLLIALVIMGVLLSTFSGFVGYTTLDIRAERISIANAQALALAEAGADKAIYELNQNSNYAGETNTALGAGVFTTSISSVDANTKRITSTGYIPNSTSPLGSRTIKVSANIDLSVVSFRYGVQVGEGGLVMNNNSRVNGSMYSNGNISGSGIITGDATVAGGTQPVADQVWSVQNGSFNLGDITARANLAQSFRPSVSTTLNKVGLYLKKVGTPSDITIKIVTNNNSKPSNNVLASASIPASLITSSFGFADTALDTPPNLTSNQTYWIIAIASVNANNYYVWGDDTANGYANGTGKYSANWEAGNPTWNSVNADLDFKTYMGGTITSLSGISVNGNAWAHSLSDCTIGGNATYQTISNCSVGGTSIPTTTDAPSVAMPISDAQITEWETTATSGGVIEGQYTINNTQTLGPKKINGDLVVTGTLYLSGPIWVNGDITFANNAHLIVSAGVGNSGAVLIADNPSSPASSGKIILSNNVDAEGNGNPNSYVMLISNYTGLNDWAINVSNLVDAVILYAPRGKIEISNNAFANQITAYQLQLNNNAIVTYLSGLQNATFSNGPGGSWTYIPGSYVIVQ